MIGHEGGLGPAQVTEHEAGARLGSLLQRHQGLIEQPETVPERREPECRQRQYPL
jgi:hypothetical protein